MAGGAGVPVRARRWSAIHQASTEARYHGDQCCIYRHNGRQLMNSDASSIYDALMALEDFSRLSSKKMIEGIAKLVDASGDLGRDEGLIRALEWCDNAEQQGLSDARATLVEYYRANAWGHRKQIKNRDQSSVWAWEQPELQNQVWHLRHAVAHAGFESLPPASALPNPYQLGRPAQHRRAHL